MSHPKGKFVQVDVISWEEQSTTRIPTCVITGSSFDYRKIMELQGKKFADKTYMDTLEALKATNTSLTHTNAQLSIRNNFLEDENQAESEEKPEDYRKAADNRMEAARKRHRNIMSTGQSRWRFLNMKTFAMLLIVICVGFLATHFLFGWP